MSQSFGLHALPPGQTGLCMHVCTTETIQSRPNLYACDRRPAHFPPTLTDYPFHFVYLHDLQLLKEKFQPLHEAVGPSQPIKTQSINTLPLGSSQTGSPLPRSGLCYLHTGLSLTLERFTAGTTVEDFEMSQVQLQPRSKGQSVSIKLTSLLKTSDQSASSAFFWICVRQLQRPRYLCRV